MIHCRLSMVAKFGKFSKLPFFSQLMLVVVCIIYMLDCNLEGVLDLHDVNLWHALWCKMFHVSIVFWFSFADCKNVVASAICLDR